MSGVSPRIVPGEFRSITVPQDTLYAICDLLGVLPTRVASIHINPKRVDVELYVVNKGGGFELDEEGKSPKTRVLEMRVVPKESE